MEVSGVHLTQHVYKYCRTLVHSYVLAIRGASVRGKAPLHHSKFGYEQGWFVEGDARLFVSRGVGVTFLPIRIDAPPEAPILTCVAPKRSASTVQSESAAQLVESSARD
jgi:hypothetical protein